MKPLPRPRKIQPGKKGLSPIAEKLDNADGQQSPGPSDEKTLVTVPPSSPELSPSLPSPPPPSPPPSSCSRTPITAYCIPFYNPRRTGCLLKVAKAEAGSDLQFKLTSTNGERTEPILELQDGSTLGHRFVFLQNQEEYYANLTGTVEYKNAPWCSWPVQTQDPSVQVVFLGNIYPKTRDGEAVPRYRVLVPMGNGETMSLFREDNPEIHPNYRRPVDPPMI